MLPRLLGVVLLAGALGSCAEPPYSNADYEQLKALLAQDVPIYDIRREAEWRSTGVVEGSHTLTFVDAGHHQAQPADRGPLIVLS